MEYISKKVAAYGQFVLVLDMIWIGFCLAKKHAYDTRRDWKLAKMEKKKPKETKNYDKTITFVQD